MSKKRILICLSGGVICAAICSIGMKFSRPDIASTVILMSGIGNRILMGFVIGISRWKINYLIHGAIIGLVVTLSISIGLLFQDLNAFMMYTVAGIIYGILIELLATKIFKAKLE